MSNLQQNYEDFISLLEAIDVNPLARSIKETLVQVEALRDEFNSYLGEDIKNIIEKEK